jgi:curved DNA-binding protein CbpA
VTGRQQDPYAVLGVPRDASQAEISHAYRALLRRHHPDTRDADDEVAGADAALARTIAAYLVVGDPASRARHDLVHGRPSPRPRQIPVAQPPPRMDAEQQPPIQAGPVRWLPPRVVTARRARDPG